jgi:hypothetical protein
LKRGKKFPPQKKERCHNEHNQPEHNLNSDKDTMASNFMSKMKLKMMTHNLFSFECAFCSLFYFHENPNFNLLLGLRSFSSNHFSWNKKNGSCFGQWWWATFVSFLKRNISTTSTKAPWSSALTSYTSICA